MNGKDKQNEESYKRRGLMGLEEKTRERLDLDKLCKFRGSEAEDIKEYLKYVKCIYPNDSNNLGVLMHSKIDETSALRVLHSCGYNVQKAKFLLTFPSLCRQMRNKRWGANLESRKLDSIFQRYVFMNSQLHSKKEATHFTKILEGIDKGKLEMSFEELSEIITEARSNKYKLPSSVRKLFEDAFNGSREIEKVLEGSKKMEDLQLLFDRIKGLLVLPQNFHRLKDFLTKARQFEKEILQIMTATCKNVKDMQSKMNSLKVLCLKSSVGDPIHEFRELWEKTHKYLEDIQHIVNPYNTKSNQRKSDFSKANKMLQFFLKHKIQDQKIDALYELVADTTRVLNVASLFLEDSDPVEDSFLEGTLDFLQKSRFDMKSIIFKVKQRSEFLKELSHLQHNWQDEDKINQNLKRIQKLKKMKDSDKLGKLEEFELCLLNLQKIR